MGAKMRSMADTFVGSERLLNSSNRSSDGSEADARLVWIDVEAGRAPDSVALCKGGNRNSDERSGRQEVNN